MPGFLESKIYAQDGGLFFWYRFLTMKNSLKRIQIGWLLVVFFLSSGAYAGTEFENRCSALASQKGQDAKRLHKLFDLTWDYDNRESPESATYNGYPGQNDRWTDNSLEAIARRKREAHAPLLVLNSIARNKLSPADQLNYDLFRHDTEEGLEGQKFPGEYFQVSQLGGPHKDTLDTIAQMPTSTLKDYENIIARLKGIPTVVHQATILLQEGIKKKVVVPKILMRDVPDQIKQTYEESADKSPFLVGFERFPDSLSKTEQEKLRAEATQILNQSVYPALKEFYKFIKETYVPACRETIALEALPDGKAWYAYLVRLQTTTKMSPEEIHQLGLSEVERIRKEMEQIRQEVKYRGSLLEFMQFLRSDSQFFYKSADDLLRGYRDIAKRIDPELIHQFGKLPRLPYGVKPVPSYSEKTASTAYYEGGSAEAGRAGYFFANTYDLKSRPRWEMEPLTLHEAVPGHHLQISLGKEMTNVPEFRKNSGYTAFIEGWGLYAESLGKRLGLYQDPYSRFGALTYEIWRSVRLVVDTGMHHLGWSRQKAIDYFMENAGKAEHDIIVEVDRYIDWPGQALAYKIGQLKFKALKEKAAKSLGDNFDVRAFHDALLENGALPLDVLDARMDLWLKNASSAQARKSGK
jgi:uncharacterized protein (DUF885 family)